VLRLAWREKEKRCFRSFEDRADTLHRLLFSEEVDQVPMLLNVAPALNIELEIDDEGEEKDTQELFSVSIFNTMHHMES
jgi:hypothetical protein